MRSYLCALLGLVSLPVMFVIMLWPLSTRAEDVVELRSGAKVRGDVISRDAKEITIKAVISNRTFTRTYPLANVQAVTIDGKREVLGTPTGGSTSAATKSTKSTKSSGPAAAASPDAGEQRSPAEVQELIDRLGRTPPDWFDSTPLVYPPTLDLSWPMPPPKPWDNQKNVGQYVWDVINPNPGKWREGVRLMHHLLVVNKAQPDVQQRAMASLGKMYHSLHEDYARAAFWWQQAGVEQGRGGPLESVHLAECYWRLGSTSMAVRLLSRLPQYPQMIKLWADMGETRKALQMAEMMGRSGNNADLAWLWAADACRVAGDYPQAIKYYEKCLAIPATGQQKGRIERTQDRARASLEAIKLFELSDVARVADGRYTASSLGYEAQVAVEVAVRSQKIESVRVTQHREKQFYSSISDTPRKIVARQGVQGVDATSGATITSEAIINATAKALASGAK